MTDLPFDPDEVPLWPGEQIPPFVGKERGDEPPMHLDESEALHTVSLEEFAAVEEPGAAPLIGTDGDALVPEGGDLIAYGSGGAGKTTLMLDLTCHLAAGDPWLGMPTARAVRVLLIEDEGPRPLFRKKVARKLGAWRGSPLAGRVTVLDHPWAAFRLTEALHRAWLANTIRRDAIDVVIAGPVTGMGMEDAGTIAEVRSFMALLNEVRELAGRIVAFGLVHHENKAGSISGAWEGVGDTLLHVQAQGHGLTRVFVQKARFSTTHHGETLNLAWADEGEGFRLVEQAERTEADIENAIVAATLMNGGRGWSVIDDAVPGNAVRKRTIRDRLVLEGRLLMQTRGKRMELWHPDDPALPAGMRPGADA